MQDGMVLLANFQALHGSKTVYVTEYVHGSTGKKTLFIMPSSFLLSPTLSFHCEKETEGHTAVPMSHTAS